MTGAVCKLPSNNVFAGGGGGGGREKREGLSTNLCHIAITQIECLLDGFTAIYKSFAR